MQSAFVLTVSEDELHRLREPRLRGQIAGSSAKCRLNAITGGLSSLCVAEAASLGMWGHVPAGLCALHVLMKE